jgi:Beta/Gamma crystallin
MLKFTKQLTALAILTVASLGGAILTQTNVFAQNERSGGVKDVTLYSKPNRQGASFKSDQGVPNLKAVGFDNKASSIAVNNAQKWRFYKNPNFHGEFIEIGPNQSRGNLGMLNNQVSSFKSVP